MKIRSLKQALESGYYIYSLYAKESTRVRVTVKEMHHVADRDNYLQFWIDRKYFERNYENEYKRL